MADLTPQQIQYQMEHLHESRRPHVISSAIILIVLTTTAVALRFAVRKSRKIPLWWDDWLCFIALPFSILGAVLSIANKALGYHVLALTVPEVEQYLKILFAGEIQYIVGIVLAKWSILALYRRVFPMSNVPRIWRICWWTLSVLTPLMLAFTFSSVFQCHPVSYFWNRTIPGGYCSSGVPYFRANAICNILLDVSILLLPLPVLSKLQMGKSKKIGLILLFLLGGFVCVTSIIRLTLLEQFADSDPTWTEVDATLWSFIEPTTALICACLPILVPPFCGQIVAFTSSIYSSYSRSKEETKGTVITIGQRQSSPRMKRSFLSQLAAGKDVSIPSTLGSDIEMSSPIVPQTGFGGIMYDSDDLEKGVNNSTKAYH